MMTFVLLIEILLPIIAAVCGYYVGTKNARVRDLMTLGTCAVCFTAAAVILITGYSSKVFLSVLSSDGLGFCLDGFRRLYLTVITFAFLASNVLALEYLNHGHNNGRYYLFLLLTLGAVNGVFLSSDLMTAFTFYEIASFTSFVWVIHEETGGAIKAGNTYLAIAVIGGLCAYMGILLIKGELGTLILSELLPAVEEKGMNGTVFAGGVCVLLGFGAKAGMFPVHIWLPKAHPVAPAPASALLSGILTKVGIYGAAAVTVNVFLGSVQWGILVLILGTITMVLGAVMGVLSIDLKRTLACSSMSQIGFVLVGLGSIAVLGEENTIAAYGTVLHMMNHSIFKIILFCCAGVVYMNLHALDLNVIRGFGRKKYKLMVPFLMGALGIGGVPLFSGYISKTLLHEGLLETVEFLPSGIVTGFEWLFLFSGGCTVAYMTKLFTVIFVEKNTRKLQKKYDAVEEYEKLPTFVFIMAAAVPAFVFGIPAVMKIIGGSAVGFFNAEGTIHTEFFGFEALKGAAISIVLGALIFWAQKKLTMKNGEYVNVVPEDFDLEESVYKPFIGLLTKCFGAVWRLFGENVITGRICLIIEIIGRIFAKAMSETTDAIALKVRKTILNEKRPAVDLIAGDSFTEAAGVIADKLTHESQHAIYYAGIEHKLLTLEARLEDSFTFALATTCLGICIVLAALIFVIRM